MQDVVCGHVQFLSTFGAVNLDHIQIRPQSLFNVGIIVLIVM